MQKMRLRRAVCFATRHAIFAALSCGLLVCFFSLTALHALNPPPDVSQYAHTAWTTRDGLLKSGVRAISQTPDGYLWLATEFGLVRFDGVRFLDWTPPAGQRLPSTNIRSLIAARDGTLWIGTLKGLASFKDGKLTSHPEAGEQNVLALLEDSDGTIWAGTFGVPNGRLCAIRNGATQCSGEDGGLGQWVWSIYEDRERRVWVGAASGLWQWKPGPPKRNAMPHPIETAQSIGQLAPQAGPLAVAQGIWQLIEGAIREYPLATPPGRFVSPVNVYADSQGGLWVGTVQDGLLHMYRGRTSQFTQSDGLSSERVLSFFEDREHNLWVGTAEGLDRFHEPVVYSFGIKQGLSSRSLWAVLAARDQSVWMTTLDGLNRWKDGHVTVYRSAANQSVRTRAIQSGGPAATSGEARVTEKVDPGLPDDRVGSLYEDDSGRIWVSTVAGIARFDGTRFTHIKELPSGWVNAIAGDNAGGVWVSYQDQGLVHWRNGKVLETLPWSRVAGEVVASSITPDPQRGGLWIGFFEGGVVYFKDGQVRAQYGATDGLGGGRVMGLLLDADGTLWASTEGGLSRIDDKRVTTLTTANGLPCDTVHWTEQADGYFWLYTACGLLRVPRTELAKWTSDPRRPIQFTTFGTSDGVVSHALLTGYTPHVSKAPDGKLWFAHFESVSVVDPHKLSLNALPPPVHIEQVTANGKTYAPVEGLRLPPRIRDLTIDYTGLSLVAPEAMYFRYILQGQDKAWRAVLNDRKVQYSNLAPGAYRFRVTASNNSGVWNETGASLDFSIAPAYYQTLWFRALCIAAIVALAWAMYQRHVRQLQHEFAMALDARVSERTRIARDLHDTLLQSFHALLLRFQIVSHLLPEGSEAKQKLASAINEAARAIGEGRDAVQGLRDAVVEGNDLARGISAAGKQLAAEPGDKPPAFRVVVEGESRNLHPMIREEVYRIAVEALRNAARHAHASQIDVELRYEDAQFRLRVRDNGCGMDQALLQGDSSGRHFGIAGMRERAAVIAGQLTIESEPGAGTELILLIPGSVAYEAVRKRFWLTRRFAAKA